MVTTTMSEPPSTYAEHDRLGPLGGKNAVLDDGSALRAALIREFQDAVQVARASVAAVDQGPATAVHSARKALRRARAVLSMMAPALPKSERKEVRRGLQDARRALSAVRDHAVAPDTLTALTLPDDARATAKRALANAASALPAMTEIRQLLAESAARAAAQAEAIEAALPQTVAWKTVAEGIQTIYGEARRARRASKRSKQSFHTWRRRTKELEYQLEFVARHAGPRVAAIHGEFETIAAALSPAVDLIMVREFVATHSQGIPAAEIDALIDAIDVQLADQMKAARRAGKDVFQQKPRRFEKRLAKSVRRDLAPADEADANALSD
jgi:CHAD domain-containing protein